MKQVISPEPFAEWLKKYFITQDVIYAQISDYVYEYQIGLTGNWDLWQFIDIRNRFQLGGVFKFDFDVKAIKFRCNLKDVQKELR